MARLVADDPRLKAAVDTGDPPTVQPLARGYQEQLNAALMVLTDKNGSVLAELGDLDIAEGGVRALPEIQQALAGHEAVGFWPHANGVLQVMALPIAIGRDRPEIMGALVVGFRLDNTLALQFKRATESDIAFAVEGDIKRRPCRRPIVRRSRPFCKTGDVQTVSLTNGEGQVALKRPLTPAAGAASAAPASAAPSVLLLRSRTERLRFSTPFMRASGWWR